MPVRVADTPAHKRRSLIYLLIHTSKESELEDREQRLDEVAHRAVFLERETGCSRHCSRNENALTLGKSEGIGALERLDFLLLLIADELHNRSLSVLLGDIRNGQVPRRNNL